MKKVLALILALVMMLGIFAACSDKPEEPNKPDDPGRNDPIKQPDDQDEVRTYPSKQIEAVVATAEAYAARRTFIQYDDASMVESSSSISPSIRRADRLKYSPEDATSQFTWYTNCASWTYDVYYQALGIDIVAWTTMLLKNATDMQVFNYTVNKNATDEEKTKILEEFMNTVQPGDILVCRHSTSNGGHAMLYIGYGEILHSSGSGSGGASYDYSVNADKLEPQGTVQRKSLDSLKSSGDNYYFFNESWWGIIRPLNKYTDAQPTEQALNRIANMQNIVAEKQSTATSGSNVKAGDEITYTFQIRNSRKTDATLDIVDTLDPALTYVSGAQSAEGNILKWTVTVGANKTEKYSYTVKVNDTVKDGDKILSNSTIGGVSVNCRPVYVGNHLSAEQQASITEAAQKIGTPTVFGTALAQKIYADAGITISLDAESDIINGVFKAYKTTTDRFEVDTSSKYFGLIVPTMYGGYHVVTSGKVYETTYTEDSLFDGIRTKGPQANQLMIGDIVIGIKKDKVASYMYCGANKLIDLTEGKQLDLLNSKNALLGTLGHDKFVIIRPALAQ